MDNDSDFVSYLYLSKEKFSIYIFNVLNMESLYEKEIIIKNLHNELDFEKIKDFLDENIIKSEKTLKYFIKNIFVILDTENFFPIFISVKKDNGGNFLNLENLSYLLNDAKLQCKKTMEEKEIIHMLVENYQIDSKDYPFLPKELKCNYFSLDVKFICLSKMFIKNLEKCLSRYQISIDQIISANYLRDHFKDNHDLCRKAWQITEGCNPNEIKFYDKSYKNKGFFEKFFNFFR
tara:strand:- start:1003 stop:1704 length:702 start_codon:yes stop_codon:yes gene_type:complete